MIDIAIVDYGVGNLASVLNMIRKCGVEARLIDAPDRIEEPDKLILPGVGAWDAGMSALNEGGFAEPIKRYAASGRPLLGICLGMQLLLDASEEGSRAGLGLVPGLVRRFDPGLGVRVPHMGWNVAVPTRASTLFPDNDEVLRFYFVHSYYAECANLADAIAVAHHGRDFTCAVERANVMGVQFHPEKSHRFGMALLRRFVDMPIAVPHAA